MSEKPDNLNRALIDALLRQEPKLLEADDEAVKRASFVLAHLLGAVLAIACARHGSLAYEGLARIAKKQIDKTAARMADGEVTPDRMTLQ